MANIEFKGEFQWQARIRRKGYPEQSKTFERQIDAQQWARKIESEMDAGSFIDRKPLEKKTLGDLLKQYGEEITPHKKGADKEQSKIKVLLRNKIAKMSLNNIEAADIVDFRNARVLEVSGGTVTKEMNLISHVFTIAKSEWRLRGLNNPVEGVRRPKATKGRVRRLEDAQEMELIIVATESPTLGAFIRIAVETAMRRSEMTGIKWRNVNLIRQTIDLIDTKNGEDRTVPLSLKAVDTIKHIPRTTDMLFNVKPASMTQAFTRAVKRARKTYEIKCKEDGVICNSEYLTNLHLHDMRHEATSRLFETGEFNAMEVSEITGHKGMNMLKRYTHLDAHRLAKKLK